MFHKYLKINIFNAYDTDNVIRYNTQAKIFAYKAFLHAHSIKQYT